MSRSEPAVGVPIDASDLQGLEETLAAHVRETNSADSDKEGYLGDDEVNLLSACDHMVQHGI